MQSIKDFLIEIGFGKNETDVYLALATLGTASVLEISKSTGLHRSNIYDALRSLIKEGLVFEVNKPTKMFSARSPRTLMHFLERKELELGEIIKDYEKRHASKCEVEEVVKITKGNFALKEAINSFLNDKGPVYVFGIPSDSAEKIGPSIKFFHEERIKKGIKMYHIYNSDSEQRAKESAKMKLTEVRLLPKKYDSNVSTNISGNKVFFFVWDREPTIVEIYNRDIANTYKNYFDMLWSKSKKLD